MSFGKSESLFNTIQHLQQKYNIPANIGVEELRKILEELFISVEGTTKLVVVGDINIAYQATSGTRNANIGVLSVGTDASIKTKNINIGEKGSMLITLNDSANQIDATINNAGTFALCPKSRTDLQGVD